MKPVTTRSVRYRAVVDNDSQARRLPTSIVDQGVRNAIAANGARCLYDRGNVSYSIMRVWIFFSPILERKRNSNRGEESSYPHMLYETFRHECSVHPMSWHRKDLQPTSSISHECTIATASQTTRDRGNRLLPHFITRLNRPWTANGPWRGFLPARGRLHAMDAAELIIANKDFRTVACSNIRSMLRTDGTLYVTPA